jgi:hypothetical protein
MTQLFMTQCPVRFAWCRFLKTAKVGAVIVMLGIICINAYSIHKLRSNETRCGHISIEELVR